MSEILTFALPVIAAVVYSLAIYLKKVTGDGQPFEPAKFGATLVYGLILGGIALYTGVAVTDANIGILYAAYTGVLVLLESGIKAIFRTAVHKTSAAGLSLTESAIAGRRVVFEANGIVAVINERPEYAHLEEKDRWVMICPNGQTFQGTETNCRRLMTGEDTTGWRKRYAGCTT